MVADLKVKLQKAKEAAQLAKEAVEAEKQALYLFGMEETQMRLADELSEVCRDHCNVTWDRALSIAGVPADSVWRQPGSIYYHPYICKVLSATSSPLALVPKSFEQPLAIPVALPLPEASMGSSQVGDQGQRAEGEKEKGKGKGKKPSAEAKDKEAAAKVKEVLR